MLDSNEKMIMTKDIKRKTGLSTQDLKTGNLVE